MDDNKFSEPSEELSVEYKTIAVNTFYSVLNTYGSFILTFAISFLLARMLTVEELGISILASSIILIFVTITNFLPPGLVFSMSFYIPRYRAKNEPEKLRSFILKALYLRAIASALFFFLFQFNASCNS